jgi:hypothetical protein
VLFSRMPGERALHPTRTAVDTKLMERSGLDEISLRRVRRAFMARWNASPYAVKQALADGSICVRYRFVTDLLKNLWPAETWRLWLRYLEHTERDIEEMRQGEYPISPFIVRLFSALLGIKVDFLLMGAWPISDSVGPNIDAYPATGTRA